MRARLAPSILVLLLSGGIGLTGCGADSVTAERDRQGAVELLPEDSPVAQPAALLGGYVDDADPVLRLATDLYAEIDAMAERLPDALFGPHQSLVVAEAVEAAALAEGRVASLVPPPGSRPDGTHEALTGAAARWTDAVRSLLGADDVGRESSMARFDQVRAEARSAWNEAISALYRDTTVAPPLLP